MTAPETIRIAPPTIAKSFAAHAARYDGERDWNIGYHVRMWQQAARVAKTGKPEDFEQIYSDLRNRWQVFRPSRTPPSAKQVLTILRRLDPRLRRWRLSRLARARSDDILSVWRVLLGATPIKMNRYGPSVMAISKFLHFWNPRFFMIVDGEVMRDLVFGHAWLSDGLKAVREELRDLVPEVGSHELFDGELGLYLASLVWAGRLVTSNPGVMGEFHSHLQRDAKMNGTRVPAMTKRLEAAAVEWLLLGLVELPPSGVYVPPRRS